MHRNGSNGVVLRMWSIVSSANVIVCLRDVVWLFKVLDMVRLSDSLNRQPYLCATLKVRCKVILFRFRKRAFDVAALAYCGMKRRKKMTVYKVERTTDSEKMRRV